MKSWREDELTETWSEAICLIWAVREESQRVDRTKSERKAVRTEGEDVNLVDCLDARQSRNVLLDTGE